jgi:hypothetical protein
VIKTHQSRLWRPRWERWWRPVACWLRNRWRWREKRQVRAEVARCFRLVVPLGQLDVAALDPDSLRMAVLAEGLGYSLVLHLGYGMGEAVVVAVKEQPSRVQPLIESACRYSDEQLRGADRSAQGMAAVRSRNALLTEVREILRRHPKRATTRRRPI